MKIIRIYPSQFDEKNIETISDLKKFKKIRENTAVCYFLTSFYFRFHEMKNYFLMFFRFKLKDRSALFNRLFEQKVDGLQGGLDSIVWTLDKMVRDLITHDHATFCPFTPFYVHLQSQINEVDAYLSAKEGSLYALSDHGKVILGQSYTQILTDQIEFTDSFCLSIKPRINKKIINSHHVDF